MSSLCLSLPFSLPLLSSLVSCCHPSPFSHQEPSQEGRLKVNIIFREANSATDALARTSATLEFEFILYR
ncbi:Uncharacterized protein TCM_002717 [Theobroma cacao]|uniref:RNase H type-1 domain-containing protein n=1 Tax=Theobroma cacao TaxID=3641 RepID=A0A061DM71_THECC|nr:Uncharacterized protein TCM_002717 [Theobroma cacao]